MMIKLYTKKENITVAHSRDVKTKADRASEARDSTLMNSRRGRYGVPVAHHSFAPHHGLFSD